MPAPSYTYTLTNNTTANADHVMQNFNDILTGVTAGTKDLTISGLSASGTLSLTNNLACTSSVAVSSNVTLTNKALHTVSTAAARSLTLPSPSATLYLVVKDVTGTAGTYNITINPASGTIDGGASYVIDWNYGAVAIISDGTNYFVI
jgi:hypothetical protein